MDAKSGVEALRIEALDRAVRVSLANGGNEETSATVDRAEKYYTFLNKR